MEKEMEKQLGKRRTFKRLMTQFANKTSISAIRNIRNTKSAAGKALWTLLLICSLGAMFFHLYYLFNSFLLWPKKTTLSLGFSNLYLPAITTCNVNPVKKSHLQYASKELQNIALLADPGSFDDDYDRFDLTEVDDLDESGQGPDPYDYRNSYVDLTGAEDKREILLERFRNEYMNESSDMRRSIGHTIDDMLVGCRFGKNKCYAENFTVFQDSRYGNCYELESRKLEITRQGSESGLAMILFLQSHQYLPGITDGYGVRVHLHAPRTIPFPYESGFYVQAGQETSISLKQTVVERIGQPYGDCTTSDQFSKLYNKVYTRRILSSLFGSAFIFTLSLALINMYQCSEDDQELIQNSEADYKACVNKREIGCIAETTNAIDAKQLTCDCPEPCSETAYSMNLAYRQWPTQEFTPVLAEAVCKNSTDDCTELKRLRDEDKDSLRHQFLKLVIYYDELSYSKMKEEPDIATAQFMSDFGGAVGLWIGLSVLSFFEVFQLVARIVQFLRHKLGVASNNNKIDVTEIQGSDHCHGNQAYKKHSDTISPPEQRDP